MLIYDSRIHSAHAQSQVWQIADKSSDLIGTGLNLLCLQSHSKPECRWTCKPSHACAVKPGILKIDYFRAPCLGADQKACGLWWIRDRYSCTRSFVTSSLRKQPSFFAPGRVAFRETDVCDSPPKIPYWWRKSVPHLVRSADWFDR